MVDDGQRPISHSSPLSSTLGLFCGNTYNNTYLLLFSTTFVRVVVPPPLLTSSSLPLPLSLAANLTPASPPSTIDKLWCGLFSRRLKIPPQANKNNGLSVGPNLFTFFTLPIPSSFKV